ncbi:hypothetical protein [Modestobacter roseus]|uniref:hypothetical protein n=1 Tax=Modestobacter roseus TaxID=1181884 RepID=UPI0034DFD0CC
MSSPGPHRPRERLVALLVLGIAAVLLFSSVSWFGSDRAGVGIAQLVLGVALAVVGYLLYRRAPHT